MCNIMGEFTVAIIHVEDRLDIKVKHMTQLFHERDFNSRRCNIKLGITPFSMLYFLVKRKSDCAFAKKVCNNIMPIFSTICIGLKITSVLFLIHEQSCI